MQLRFETMSNICYSWNIFQKDVQCFYSWNIFLWVSVCLTGSQPIIVKILTKSWPVSSCLNLKTSPFYIKLPSDTCDQSRLGSFRTFIQYHQCPPIDYLLLVKALRLCKCADWYQPSLIACTKASFCKKQLQYSLTMHDSLPRDQGMSNMGLPTVLSHCLPINNCPSLFYSIP